MKKVFIVGGGEGGYIAMFHELGYYEADNIGDSSLVVFTGGADVSPELYGDKAHRATGNHPARDTAEIAEFEFAKRNSIPMVGICRGGQFLNVMNGGRMYQHVSSHTQSHMLEDARTGEKVYVSSTHHQMMMPASDAVLVAFSELHGTREWFYKEVPWRDVSDKDIEVLYYEKTKCLCFQPHPEFSVYGGYGEMKTYFSNLLEEFFE